MGIRITAIPIAILWISCFAGCATEPRAFTRVEISGMVDRSLSTASHPVLIDRGQTLIVSDTQQVRAIATYFPGLGSGQPALRELKLMKDLELKFTTESGAVITAYTKDYEYWGSNVDKGDHELRGGFLEYLRDFVSPEPHSTGLRERGK